MPKILLGLSSGKYSHFSSSTKTTFVQHGFKIWFSNQNTLVCIIKFLPTNFIKGQAPFLRKVVYFSFGSPVIAPTVSKLIFQIKATKDKNKVHSLKRERNQERIYLKECSSFWPLRKGIRLTVELQQSR